MTVIPRLLRAGIPAVEHVLGTFVPEPASGLGEAVPIAEQIEAIVARPRVSPALVASDTLDEVDVVLGELIERLEAADPGTADHSRAVSLWCARIGKRLALSASETIFVTRCGLVHDIGKMTTPPEILLAPRRLSGQETHVMRRHAEEGGAIVGGIPLLAQHKPAVRWHHERLDGQGYPDGLAGSAIPLVARIVSVADSFNAMIGNRPYRLPLRPTAAIEELWRHAKTQFDPEVVAAMEEVLTKRS
jgi:HD-GYP domain-containing protein (c-di-GMP phosphodiesterase class II)